jgi:Tfp pilus assembly ATPase PilU
MLCNTAISNLIRESQTQKIYATMTTSINQGMCPLEWSLAQKVHAGEVSLESALQACNRVSAFTGYLESLRSGKTAANIARQAAGNGNGAPVPAERAEATPAKRSWTFTK